MACPASTLNTLVWTPMNEGRYLVHMTVTPANPLFKKFTGDGVVRTVCR